MENNSNDNPISSDPSTITHPVVPINLDEVLNQLRNYEATILNLRQKLTDRDARAQHGEPDVMPQSRSEVSVEKFTGGFTDHWLSIFQSQMKTNHITDEEVIRNYIRIAFNKAPATLKNEVFEWANANDLTLEQIYENILGSGQRIIAHRVQEAARELDPNSNLNARVKGRRVMKPKDDMEFKIEFLAILNSTLRASLIDKVESQTPQELVNTATILETTTMTMPQRSVAALEHRPNKRPLKGYPTKNPKRPSIGAPSPAQATHAPRTRNQKQHEKGQVLPQIDQDHLWNLCYYHSRFLQNTRQCDAPATC